MLTVKPQREHLLVWGREPVSYSNPVFILNLSPLNLIKWLVVSATSSLCSPQRRRFPFGRQAGKLPLHHLLWKVPSVLGRPDPGSCIVHPPTVHWALITCSHSHNVLCAYTQMNSQYLQYSATFCLRTMTPSRRCPQINLYGVTQRAGLMGPRHVGSDSTWRECLR